MALSSEHSSSLAGGSHTSDDEKETFADEKVSSPYAVEKRSPSSPTAVEPVPGIDTEMITYPEGGRDAWLVVLGAWCGLTASLGIYNTAGVFQVVISKVILPEETASTLGWIFSIYAFVNWFCGVQVGPTFDAMGPRVLIIAGTICTLIGIFLLSICTGKINLIHTILHASLILIAICWD